MTMAFAVSSHWATNKGSSSLCILLLLQLLMTSLASADVARDATLSGALRVLSRSRRAVTSVQVPENLAPGEVIYNLNDQVAAKPLSSYDFTIKNASGVSQTIFRIDTVNNQLVLDRSSDDFDYETNRKLEVNLEATKRVAPNVGQKVIITVQIGLQDVNDEMPVMTNPEPYQAAVSPNAPTGTVIYTVTASDADKEAKLEFRLRAGSNPRFVLGDTVGKTTTIITTGSDPIPVTSIPVLLVVVIEDMNGANQRVDKTISVTVGTLPPQFFFDSYEGQIYENTAQQVVQKKGGSESLVLRYIKFQKENSLNFILSDDRFEVIPGPANTEQITLRCKPALDHEQEKSVILTVNASETALTYSSIVTVTIQIIDENDSSPKFVPKSQFFEDITENKRNGELVFTATATDKDSGVNGEITFSIVGTDAFEVETTLDPADSRRYVASIRVKNETMLDYEKLKLIELSLVAENVNSNPPKSTTATAKVKILNANDNAPTIDSSSTELTIPSASSSNYVVAILAASDIDGDNIEFFFEGLSDTSGIFKIERQSGKITLTQSPLQDEYLLNVVTVDDGGCCIDGGRPRVKSTSTTQVTVTVEDSNEDKPDFIACDTYNTDAKVMENAPVGTSVITVSAQDNDKGENGKVFYKLDTNSNSPPFQIDAETGLITVRLSDMMVRERGKVPYIQVTVIGENSDATLNLKGYCTFRINIEDINDHPPTFEKRVYEFGFLLSSGLPANVGRMKATDGDFGENANITYSLGQNAPSFFTIDRLSGNILLQADPNVTPQTYSLTVIANDNGKNPGPKTGTTTARIKVDAGSIILPSWVNPPPVYSKTLNVDEDTPLETVLTTFQCRSNSPDNPRVEFRVFDTTKTINDNSEYFSATMRDPATGSDVYSLDIKLIKQLKYIEQKEHSVTATCQGFNGGNLRAPDIEVNVRVQDTNNEKPTLLGMSPVSGRYRASVAENSAVGTSVRKVTVIDQDENPAFRIVQFSLSEQDHADFTIEKTGDSEALVRTAKQFDREKQAVYNFKITASDGVNSDYHFMTVDITDVNDNTPAFDSTRYEFDVSETANINDQIGEVLAKDEDMLDMAKGLEYQFTGGNINRAFTILSGSGQIRLARTLDYDDPSEPKVYTLQLVAYDDGRLNSATTTVIIRVLDENDSPPQFESSEYEVRDVTEEDGSITPTNRRKIVTVKAKDRDKDRTQTKITYDLTAPSNFFEVNSTTGDVYLIGKLDREGPSSDARVGIRAADEPTNPLYDYTEVIVYPIDVNDNAPEFDLNKINFKVDEHSPRGSFVGTVLARDDDAGANAEVKYRMGTPKPGSMRSNYFTITENGQLRTNIDETALDYETFQSTSVEVVAYDMGTPEQLTRQTVTIELKDINDQIPFFLKNLYTVRMSEATESGEILRVKAEDNDTEPANRRFEFTLSPTTPHFLVDTSGDFAVISVNSVDPVDYEDDPHEFQLTLEVNDGKDNHKATTQIHITVEDFNDNAPIFKPNEIKRTLKEGGPKGELIATFSATDIDDGINAEFEYSIGTASDQYFEFYIDPYTGNVTTRKVLDRELEGTRNITIYAIDKGEIPKTGSASLLLILTDINDNAPVFAEDYRPVVPENEDNNNRLVVEIFATDPDIPKNGPPFGFALPQGCAVPACKHFSLEYNRDRDGGKGTATIRTSSRFNRESQKEYYLPVLIWDKNTGASSPESQTGTSTLTIVIGDKNDNKHSPGHQAITYYNFDGKFGDVEIGRVFAEDADDWDLPDKTFTYVSPDLYKNYFSVDSETGVITIKKGVPASEPDEPYEFEVDVYDKVFKNTARCTVAVTVKELTDEALRKAGSVRFKGITAAEFIVPEGKSVPGTPAPPSKMDKFKTEMARLLQYPGPEHIEVVSLTDGPGHLDVRFSGHASPYVSPAQMESALMLNINSVQKATGTVVDQVPVNLCMEEKYHVGCYTDLQVAGQPQVINANGSSLTTMQVALEAMDGCPDVDFPDPVACRGDYCFNGGTCLQDDWGNLMCQCLPGFDGPRCQQRRHSFDGSSTAFYQGLSACAEGRTSFEFITTEKDGLIMFSGPVVSVDINEGPLDYLILELKNGYPQLRINLGGGELRLSVNGVDSVGSVVMPSLDDGQWHRLDIDRENQEVTLTVDHCNIAVADANGTVSDWKPCRAQGRVPGGDILLNVQSLLQLGGRYPSTSPPAYPSGVPTKKFKGCLKNLFHNAKLYDLYYKPVLNWNSGTNGCPREESICGEGKASSFCGLRAHCQSRWQPVETVQACTCHPGWYGDKCATVTPIMDLKSKSFFQWELSDNLLEEAKRATSLQLMFRSRQPTGTLFALTNAAQNKIDLQLENSRLVLRYDLGQGERMLQLDSVTASDGAWHVARVERHGSEFQMTLDGGEGRSYTFRQAVETADVLFLALHYLSAGARVPTIAAPNVNQISNDLEKTCIQDVRFNGHWLPMATDQNSQADPGVSLLRSPNTVAGCSRDDCAGVTCIGNSVCHPLWEAYECRCIKGYQKNAVDVCVSACTPNPCFNNVACSITGGEVQCACPDAFTGKFCNVGKVNEEDDGLSGGAIAGIIIGIIVVLVLIILLILFLTTCRREDSEKNVLEVDPDDDFIRENVMYYDEEGAGEEDHEAYDLTLLQKMNSETLGMPRMNPPKEDEMQRRNEPKLDRPDVGSFIDSRIRDTENDDDPFKDVPLEFNYEGGNSDAGSLSSLNTSSSGGSQDYDYLNDWGPKFARLADMYGAGQNLES